MKDPDWLEWARELQAIAQTGLMFCRDPYDRERYEAIRQLAACMFAACTDEPVERIESSIRRRDRLCDPRWTSAPLSLMTTTAF